MKSFANSLPMSLLRAREAAMQHFRPSLHAVGLTEQQWRVMRCIEGKKGVGAKAISQECFILGPSLSRILNDLQKSGIIARCRNNTDLRSQTVHLTAKGRRIFDSHAEQSAAIYEKIETRVGRQKLAALITTLKEVEHALADD